MCSRVRVVLTVHLFEPNLAARFSSTTFLEVVRLAREAATSKL
jgi:hypothetical protein